MKRHPKSPCLLPFLQRRSIMFEQTSRLAEKLAASVSRRGFLGSLGGWAAAAAMGVAGVLTGAGTAWAHTETHRCCFYENGQFSAYYICVEAGQSCPASCCSVPLTAPGGLTTKCSDCPKLAPILNAIPCPFPC